MYINRGKVGSLWVQMQWDPRIDLDTAHVSSLIGPWTAPGAYPFVPTSVPKRPTSHVLAPPLPWPSGGPIHMGRGRRASSSLYTILGCHILGPAIAEQK